MFNDRIRRNRTNPTGNGDSTELDLETVRAETPEVDELLERAEQQVMEAQTEPVRRSCCWVDDPR